MPADSLGSLFSTIDLRDNAPTDRSTTARRRPRPLVHQPIVRTAALRDRTPFSVRLQQLGLALAALMAFSGQVKQVPWFAFLPGDFTVVVTAATVAVAIGFTLTSGGSLALRPVLVGLLLASVALLGVVAQSITPYGTEKATRLLLVVIPAVAAVALLVVDAKGLKQFVRNLFITAIGLSIWVVVGRVQETDLDSGRLASASGATISFGQVTGFALVCLVAWLLVARDIEPPKLVAVIALCGALTWVLLAIGSRGPIQALVAAVGAMLLLRSRRFDVRWAIRLTVILVVVGVGLSALWSTIPELSRRRILLLSSGNSADIRFEIWDWTWSNVGASLFGQGWGGWAAVTPVPGIRYPHNIILEVWFEAGLAGLLVLLIALWLPYRNLIRGFGIDKLNAVMAFGVLNYWIFAAMVSADVNSNKPLFLVLVASAVGFKTIDAAGQLDNLTGDETDEVDEPADGVLPGGGKTGVGPKTGVGDETVVSGNPERVPRRSPRKPPLPPPPVHRR